MAVVYGMTQYSIWLEAVGYPCTSCLLPASDDAKCHVPATEWCQHNLPCYLFSVFTSVCFCSISIARQHGGVSVSICNIRHRILLKICQFGYW